MPNSPPKFISLQDDADVRYAVWAGQTTTGQLAIFYVECLLVSFLPTSQIPPSVSLSNNKFFPLKINCCMKLNCCAVHMYTILFNGIIHQIQANFRALKLLLLMRNRS